MHRRQGEREVGRRLAHTPVELRVELVHEHAAGPAMFDGLPNLEFPDFSVLHAVEKDAVVFPRNLCTKLVHN